jgi:GT2 family glycosyltransferase
LQSQALNGDKPEIIVVDNGSKILPIRVCGEFSAVKLVQELTPGPGPARNLGAKLANGSILAFIDADCVAEPYWITAMLTAFEKQPQFKIFGGAVRILFADPTRPTIVESYDSFFAFRQNDYIRKSQFSATLNMAVEKATFEVVGPFGGIEIAEDRDWGQRAAGVGYPTQFAPDMVVWHPARKSFAELRAKWDRLTRHNFEDHLRLGGTGWSWLLRSAALAASPMIDVPRLFVSGATSIRQRAFAAVALVYVRLYRARLMLNLHFDPKRRRMDRVWNR